jgi:putative serine protease PepD
MTEHEPGQPDSSAPKPFPEAQGAETPQQAPEPPAGPYPGASYSGTFGYGEQPQYTRPVPPPTGYPPTSQPPYAASPPPAQPRSHAKRTVLIAALTAAVVGGGVGAAAGALTSDDHTTASAGLNVTAQNAPAVKTDGSITTAAKKIEPSVVTINLSGSQGSGTGSGVIIRSDGYILTNNHVVAVGENGGSITVITNDGKRASAKIVGTDSTDDLAVIKVDGLKDLRAAATFGKSSNLVIGQTVVAVGAPLGLSDTVTAGIVSNTARPVSTGDSSKAEAFFNAIQTDAAINPGNSGGPLVDLNGNVIGINAAIATTNNGGLNVPGESGNIGIGFAIPSDEASRIADQLITSGKAAHAVLGVRVDSSAQNRSTQTGAKISSADANSPAAAAGLKAGDVITEVGGQRIDDAVALIAAVRSHPPGEKVSLTYVRDGKTMTTQVTLGSATS